jgi:crotonobetainyl-CoA:carnitine CoA-transferase CaiB-like acyl-CoA transferase
MSQTTVSTPGTPLPLAGIRVVEFGMLMAGPYCGRILAELGAEVLKIEPPAGEQNRGNPPLRDGHSGYFGQMNAGKRSVVLDLATPAGVEAAMRLVRASDVLVENFRPGVMERLGVGYAACAEVTPRLVYCSVSGYGQTGPRSGLAALAPIINADCGFDMAQLSYQQDQSAPAATGLYVADILGAVSAFGAIMTALFTRQVTGVGQHIDVSLFDAMVSILVMDLQLAQHGHGEQGYTFRPMRTRDGFVMLSTMSQRNLVNTLTVIGQPELQSDHRFATVAAREKYKEELHEIIETWTALRSTIEVEQAFRAGRVPCSRYRTIGEVLADPQTPPSTFRTIHDGAGDYMAAGIPFTFSGTSGSMAEVLDVPPLGDYTRQALTDIAGYSAEEAERISPLTAR